MSLVKVLVLTGYGLNCDHETAHAFRLAGAAPDRVHINALIDGSMRLADYHILVFGGGFSWGDDHGAGVVQAVRLKHNIGDQILAFIEDGHLILGICNGFQTLVNLGLLPGLDGDYNKRLVALAANDCGNFRNQWVGLRVNPDTHCVFTRGLDRLELPVRHGEGKFYAEPDVMARLNDNAQTVVTYTGPDGDPAGGRYPFNPNGSLEDIAGICDTTGRVFGLMPHPEAYNHPCNHPDWTRSRQNAGLADGAATETTTLGIQIFKNAVNHVRGSGQA